MEIIQNEYIDVARAKRDIENQRPNRRLNKERAKTYARDMSSGNWNHSTGNLIRYDAQGRLGDGQTRLTALILSGLPGMYFDVAYDVPDESFEHVDTGQSRKSYQVLQIMGHGKASYLGIATLNGMLLNHKRSSVKQTALSDHERLELWKEYEPYILFATKKYANPGVKPAAICAAIAKAYYYHGSSRLDELSRFAYILDVGFPKDNDPQPLDKNPLMLRSHVLMNREKGMRAAKSYELQMKAESILHRYLTGEVMQRVSKSKGSNYFPTPLDELNL